MLVSGGGIYRDREEAGERLAALLRGGDVCAGAPGARVVVLAAPRGGVGVAVPVARALGAPLDVVLARKLPAPGNPELGLGAVGEGGVRVVDESLVQLLGVTESQVEEIAARVVGEIESRARKYRRTRPAVELAGACALVIDDGIATGATMEAAVESARRRGAAWVVAAAPVSSDEAARRLEAAADRFICPVVDPYFVGVGAYYASFPQLTDEDVVRLLESVPSGEAGRR